MTSDNLREFIKELEDKQEISYIDHPIDAHLEVTEITDRICKGPREKNKALFFKNITGNDSNRQPDK